MNIEANIFESENIHSLLLVRVKFTSYAMEMLNQYYGDLETRETVTRKETIKWKAIIRRPSLLRTLTMSGNQQECNSNNSWETFAQSKK